MLALVIDRAGTLSFALTGDAENAELVEAGGLTTEWAHENPCSPTWAIMSNVVQLRVG